MLQVSRTWLYDAARDGRIPSVRLGGPERPVRFVEEDIEEWLERAGQAGRPGESRARKRSGGRAGPRSPSGCCSQIARSVWLAAASATLCSRWP
jgi:excisionase family DNA binding protein